MIVLDDVNKLEDNKYSSKGNQFKWILNGVWYKADRNGYEGLCEYVISQLLKYSSLHEDEFVDYELDTIKYKYAIYNGCKSNNFLKNGQSVITVERLFEEITGNSLSLCLEGMYSSKEKLEYLVNSIENITGINGFGAYLSKIILIDGLFLNEDRHLHNIALIKDKDGYNLCPIFDNAASLLSDVSSYPLDRSIQEMMNSIESRTIDSDFERQIDTVEKCYGISLRFSFDENDVIRIVDGATQYDVSIRERVKYILISQMYKYNYFFETTK